jgi:O-antigen/teichoic acid export membrane protein
MTLVSTYRRTNAGGVRLMTAFASLAGTQSAAQRIAGTAFLVRVAGAAIVFASHVLLARWMGRHEFGIYAFLWTCVLLAGALAPLGLAYSAQRFIPEYRMRGDLDRLRGFLTASRICSLALGAGVALVAGLLVLSLRERIGPDYLLPALLAAAAIPLFALSSAQDAIARSFDWIRIAIIPGFIAQPLLVLALIGSMYLFGATPGATTAMAATALAIWLMVALQGALLQGRLRHAMPAGRRVYETAYWFRTALPILFLDACYFLLAGADILLLQFFVEPAQVAVYFAAAKILAVVSFVHYAASAAYAHRFSAAHVSGRRAALADLVTEAARATFWPSAALVLALLVLGWPILLLFGDGFIEGYALMPLLAFGLLARASMGPAERLFVMIGAERLCAAIYAAALALNIVLCLVLIPKLALTGAALSMAAALTVESLLLFYFARRRLGLHVFFWRGG